MMLLGRVLKAGGAVGWYTGVTYSIVSGGDYSDPGALSEAAMNDSLTDKPIITSLDSATS
jgi:hypothetical protein